MSKYIISYGRASDVAVIEAPSLDEALMIATKRSLDGGLLDDDLADTTWAAAYTDDLAYEYGLLTVECPQGRAAFAEAERAPWR